MKLLIACDMEGISGVATWDHVTLTHPEYQRFRRIMTADVNAAIEGAFAGGADEIIVTDGHWDGGNILVEELDARVRFNTGSPSPLSMVQGADSVDAAFFVGYHARAGTAHAILDHTWSSARVANVWINGKVAGETGLNASMCGMYGVPVLLLTGDQAVCAEAREWIPDIDTVQVKTAVGRSAAEVLSPKVTQPMIRSAATAAIQRFKAGKAPQPVKPGFPIVLTVEFFNSVMGDQASVLPYSKRLDGRKLEITAPDMLTAYLSFRAMVGLVKI